METRFILLDLKTSGLKCLEQEVEVQFCHKLIDKSFFEKPLIKSIYGTNGEGKTALAHTLHLYKNSVLSSNYLSGESYIGTFKEIVNQKRKAVHIDIYFSSLDIDKGPTNFHHVIDYVLKDKDLSISHEKLSICAKGSWGNVANESIIYETRDGEFTSLRRYIDKYRDDVIGATKITLAHQSAALSILSRTLPRNDENNDDVLSFYYACLQVALFACSINVFIHDSDTHYVTYAKAKTYSNLLKDENIIDANAHSVFDNEVDEIDVSKIGQYRNEIDKVTAFLKIFKPSLSAIRIDESMNKDKVMCKKVLVYKDGSEVSLEYESSGLKKLVALYPYLNAVDQGGISFIDDIDANISDIYLCKLIEYFANYTNGQLIFTAQSLGPMESLSRSKKKHSIDFINNQCITPWTRNGNYSVVNLYRSGAISNCPFNIDASDFVKTFG